MTPFAEITAADWTVIIGAVFLGLTQLLSTWIAYLKSCRIEAQTAAVADKVDVAAAKATEASVAAKVAKATAATATAVVAKKLDDLSSTGQQRTEIARETLEVAKQVHALSNGGKGVTLTSLAEQAERIAALTGHPDDLAAAEARRKLADDHAAAMKAAYAKPQ